jgi:hypothetical protein
MDYVQFEDLLSAKIAFEMGNVSFKCVICGKIHNSEDLVKWSKSEGAWGWPDGANCFYWTHAGPKKYLKIEELYYLSLTFEAFQKYFLCNDKRLRHIYRRIYRLHCVHNSKFDPKFLKYIYDRKNIVSITELGENVEFYHGGCYRKFPKKFFESV